MTRTTKDAVNELWLLRTYISKFQQGKSVGVHLRGAGDWTVVNVPEFTISSLTEWRKAVVKIMSGIRLTALEVIRETGCPTAFTVGVKGVFTTEGVLAELRRLDNDLDSAIRDLT